MIHKILVTTLLCISTLSCSNIKSSAISYVYDTELASALENVQETNKQKRSDVEFINGITVNTCADYLNQLQSSNLTESVNNQIVKNEYLMCEHTSLLSRTNITHTEEQQLNFGIRLWESLNLSTFPNTLNRAARGNLVTLKELVPDESSYKNNQVIYDSDHVYLSIRVIAEANLDTNPQKDWIVELIEETKTSNYRNYATIIVYNPKAKQIFEGSIFTLK